MLSTLKCLIEYTVLLLVPEYNHEIGCCCKTRQWIFYNKLNQQVLIEMEHNNMSVVEYAFPSYSTFNS